MGFPRSGLTRMFCSDCAIWFRRRFRAVSRESVFRSCQISRSSCATLSRFADRSSLRNGDFFGASGQVVGIAEHRLLEFCAMTSRLLDNGHGLYDPALIATLFRRQKLGSSQCAADRMHGNQRYRGNARGALIGSEAFREVALEQRDELFTTVLVGYAKSDRWHIETTRTSASGKHSGCCCATRPSGAVSGASTTCFSRAKSAFRYGITARLSYGG